MLDCPYLLQNAGLCFTESPEPGLRQYYDLMARLSFALGIQEFLTHLNRFIKWRRQFALDKNVGLMAHFCLRDAAGLS